MSIDVRSNSRQGYGRIVFLCGAVAALAAPSGAPKVWVTDIVVNLPTQDSSPKSFRNIGVGVQNDTDAAATFDITCEWKCPYGNLKNWSSSIEQGAYLDSRKSRGYERDANMGCDPIPSELKISCNLAKRGPKNSEGKTTWTVLNTGTKTVKIPRY